jgi:hypothetical protein
VREQSAIEVWPLIDATVEVTNVDVPGPIAERYHVARKVTSPSPGLWHYEYAVHNLNSDRSARAFSIDFPTPTTITNVGFRDVDHHSGEPYDTADWTAAVDADGVSWSTDDFATDANANALRWATMFSFWFDASSSEGGIDHALELFKPGSPTAVEFGIGDDLFADGFETGDTGAWTLVVP